MVKLIPVLLTLLLSACGNENSPAPLVGSGEIETMQISVGELTFDAYAAGPQGGEPVILLHGFPESAWEFHRQLSALGLATYRAVAPNQRGYSPGARPDGVDAYRMDRLVADVLGMADALGFERFHLVGHDWGAIVAWSVAAAAPERLLTLNPISVPHPGAFARVLADRTSCQYEASSYVDFFVTPGVANLFLANQASFFRGIFAGVPPEDVDVHLATLGTPAALDAAINWYRANFNGRDGLRSTAPNTTVPTMYVWSDGDAALCRDGAELTGEYVDAPYRFEIIAGASHWVPEVAADQLTTLLLDHLASAGS